MLRYFSIAVSAAFLALSFSQSACAGLIESKGHITFLRLNDVGTGYGPPTDYIDVELVVQLDSLPGKAFGFQLRNDSNMPARQGMLDLLRDAFSNNLPVLIDYNITPPKNNGVIIRVAVVKQ
jgi:hypothetical protein